MASSCVAPPEHLRLSGRPDSVGRARRFINETLTNQGLPTDLVDTAVLLTSEVVTNSIVHVGDDLMVSVVACTGRAALVQVVDASPQHPVTRLADVEAVTGRGLAMVELLAADYGSASSAGGKVVWFSVGDSAAVPAPGPRGWAPATVEDPRATGVEIDLRAVPAGLYGVLHHHNDALVREYQLHLLLEQWSGTTQTSDSTGHRAQLAAVARTRSIVASQVLAAMRESPHAGDRVDAVLRLTPDDVAACAVLADVLDEAEALAARGAFLARPALPEMLSLRDWIYGEVTAQAGGAPPTEWVPGETLLALPRAPAIEIDLTWVASTAQALVVADDANRVLAVSPAVADLLGWADDELAGRRITVIIPPSLRQAHVTAFARHVQTGVSHIIGEVVDLPARHREGHEVQVSLRLEQRRQGSRTLYLGWLARAGQMPPSTLP